MNMQELLAGLLKCSFGLNIARDFYGGNNRAYKDDKGRFNLARREARKLLLELGTITVEELAEACKVAFSGRLSLIEEKERGYNAIIGYHLEYTAGQFYDLELPQAVLSVLERVKANRNTND